MKMTFQERFLVAPLFAEKVNDLRELQDDINAYRDFFDAFEHPENVLELDQVRIDLQTALSHMLTVLDTLA